MQAYMQAVPPSTLAVPVKNKSLQTVKTKEVKK
jgi:hypothetical protein